jgi:hypothetical protein
MKKFLWLTVVLFVICFYYSCTKDKTQAPADTTCIAVDSTTNTYNQRIKLILDANCAYVGCHDAQFHSGGVILATYNDAKTAFENMDALCSIKQEGASQCEPMPQGSPKLADSLITYIQCWAGNNYPQ